MLRLAVPEMSVRDVVQSVQLGCGYNERCTFMKSKKACRVGGSRHKICEGVVDGRESNRLVSSSTDVCWVLWDIKALPRSMDSKQE